jgi:hypothetical protein
MIGYMFEHLIKELKQFVKIGSIFIRKMADIEFQPPFGKSKRWIQTS